MRKVYRTAWMLRMSQALFSDDGDTAVPRGRQMDPEQLRSFETGKLLLPLGGLGTDR